MLSFVPTLGVTDSSLLQPEVVRRRTANYVSEMEERLEVAVAATVVAKRFYAGNLSILPLSDVFPKGGNAHF